MRDPKERLRDVPALKPVVERLLKNLEARESPEH